ncbi:MAG TPA: hypothetical protein VLS93_04760 [Anaeromyxobacteraceae bacterium]|nr:hypothetical protein [Anaeromyxobacteraceae bacterium]
MNRCRTRRPRLLAARGAVSWVTLLLLALLAAGVYLAWVWGPVYLTHYRVNQVVTETLNRAVKDRNDTQLVEEMCKRIRALAEVEEVQDDGQVELVPAVSLYPQDVTWQRETTSARRVLRVSFSYTRDVVHPWIDRIVEKTFDVDVEFDADPVSWEPKR